MSCLHTISRSPHSQLLQTCLSTIQEDDALLFIEDGVYYSTVPHSLEKIPHPIRLFSLREDMLARAIHTRVADNVESIDYHRFVELSCEYDKTVSWF